MTVVKYLIHFVESVHFFVFTKTFYTENLDAKGNGQFKVSNSVNMWLTMYKMTGAIDEGSDGEAYMNRKINCHGQLV